MSRSGEFLVNFLLSLGHWMQDGLLSKKTKKGGSGHAISRAVEK